MTYQVRRSLPSLSEPSCRVSHWGTVMPFAPFIPLSFEYHRVFPRARTMAQASLPQAGGRIGFLGAGKMATALARGWLQAGLVGATRLAASDPVAAARDAFTHATGVKAGDNNLPVIQNSDVVVLAVKPQNMDALLEE